MLEISSTAYIKDKIKSTYAFNGLNFETITEYVTPAPIISSVSVSELPKSKTGKTFNITGGNFADITSVTSTAGTVTSYIVNSTTSISVVIDTGTATGYTNVTVTSATGTTTLTNCIRMYTQVIPGTDVAWNNVTGAVDTGAGYIRRNTTATSYAAGGNFLVTSSTTVDFEVEYYYDTTNYAITGVVWEALNGLSASATANATNRYASYNYYFQKGLSGTPYHIYAQQIGSTRFYDNNNIISTTSTRYFHKRFSGQQVIGLENYQLTVTSTPSVTYMETMAMKGYNTSALYMDFCLSVRAGFKDILAKIYD